MVLNARASASTNVPHVHRFETEIRRKEEKKRKKKKPVWKCVRRTRCVTHQIVATHRSSDSNSWWASLDDALHWASECDGRDEISRPDQRQIASYIISVYNHHSPLTVVIISDAMCFVYTQNTVEVNFLQVVELRIHRQTECVCASKWNVQINTNTIFWEWKSYIRTNMTRVT